jgi:class 3 adenylate cyclase
MQQVADWLKTLGMSEYEQLFAENRIDLSVLPDLTDQHLKELGVPLGHRLKMLRAVRELSGPVSSNLQPERRSQDAAERRQVTVMFCDLVGSTALSARMDSEDLREVISAYQKQVAETVGRFGGFVAKYMGWCARLFRLPTSSRGRRRASGARRAHRRFTLAMDQELRGLLQVFYATRVAPQPHSRLHSLDPQIGPYRCIARC